MSETKLINYYHIIGAWPENYVYIGRGRKNLNGKFGNPYRVKSLCPRCGEKHNTGGSTLPCYEAYLKERMVEDSEFREEVLALKQKVLVCFCRPIDGFCGKRMCHGQILISVIDGVPPEAVE